MPTKTNTLEEHLVSHPELKQHLLKLFELAESDIDSADRIEELMVEGIKHSVVRPFKIGRQYPMVTVPVPPGRRYQDGDPVKKLLRCQPQQSLAVMAWFRQAVDEPLILLQPTQPFSGKYQPGSVAEQTLPLRFLPPHPGRNHTRSAMPASIPQHPARASHAERTSLAPAGTYLASM